MIGVLLLYSSINLSWLQMALFESDKCPQVMTLESASLEVEDYNFKIQQSGAVE